MKNGQRVNVKAFTATVVDSWHSETATTHVVDENGNSHYIFDSQLEAASPFIDGKKYIDNDGAEVTFRATGNEGSPGWQVRGGAVVAFCWAERPIREWTPIIEEED